MFSCFDFVYKPAYTEVPLTRSARLALCELGQGLRPRHPRCHLATPTMLLVVIAKRL